jgi:opacity protein-like surface antigen
MFKKLLIASAILAATTTGAFAYGNWGPGAPYVGASIANETVTASGNYRGFSGNLNVGYGAMVWPCVYLGGELFGIPGSAQYTSRTPGGVQSTKPTWGWGGSLNPGWYMNDKTMIYGRVGGMQRHFSSANVNRGAWLVGAGAQINWMPNLDVRGEYVYSQYPRISNVGTPLVDTFNVGLVYKIT